MASMLLLAAALCLGTSLAEQGKPSDADINEMWARFKKDFKRNFNSNDDEALRAAVFRDNVLAAYKMNVEQGVSCGSLFDDRQCVFGINDFSDMSPKEFAATKLGYKRSSTDRPQVEVLSPETLPAAADTVDWRSKGAVTAVKNQGTCGSCWAFSTTETVESQVFMSTGKLLTLSTQQIVACDHNGDKGCQGGDTVTAYQYLEKAGGLDTASDYPDTSSSSGSTGKCKWDNETAAKVSGFSYGTKPCTSGACTSQDEDALAAALAAKGPISICVNAGGGFFGLGWQLYRGGIFSTTCSSAASKMDHCVQLVGYDKTGPTPYWIVRNSWAKSWGIDGYMHLEMGKNLCGVANEATIPKASLGQAAGFLTV